MKLEPVEKENVKGRITKKLKFANSKISSERCMVLREPVLGGGRKEIDSGKDFPAGI